jgi:hypothetical protein
MIKAPIHLQDLRRRIYRKAKSEKTHRFWGLFVHVTKIETLEEAYRIGKGNGGAPGIDGQSFRDIESAGRAAFLAAVREDLVTGRHKPMPNRLVEIPKDNGKFRTLQIPCIRDHVVQGALKLILDAVFEADFCPNSYTRQCNHRDEKSSLGVAQGQVRNPNSVRRLPQLQVAGYSLLLLASLLSSGFQRTAEYLPLPKWRRRSIRPSLLDVLALLRDQIFATAADAPLLSFDDFADAPSSAENPQKQPSLRKPSAHLPLDSLPARAAPRIWPISRAPLMRRVPEQLRRAAGDNRQLPGLCWRR